MMAVTGKYIEDALSSHQKRSVKGDKCSSPHGSAGKVFRFEALIKAALSQESFVKLVDFLFCLFRPAYQVIEQDKKKIGWIHVMMLWIN